MTASGALVLAWIRNPNVREQYFVSLDVSTAESQLKDRKRPGNFPGNFHNSYYL